MDESGRNVRDCSIRASRQMASTDEQPSMKNTPLSIHIEACGTYSPGALCTCLVTFPLSILPILCFISVTLPTFIAYSCIPYTLLSYLRIRYLILCLFYSNAFYVHTFFCNQLLLASGVGCTDSRSLTFSIYFFSLTNPNTKYFRVRSIVYRNVSEILQKTFTNSLNNLKT